MRYKFLNTAMMNRDVGSCCGHRQEASKAGLCSLFRPQRESVELRVHLADCDTDLHAARVESASNIADGPTRDYFELLHVLGARFVEPRLPDWLHDVWNCSE